MKSLHECEKRTPHDIQKCVQLDFGIVEILERNTGFGWEYFPTNGIPLSDNKTYEQPELALEAAEKLIESRHSFIYG